MTLLQSADWSEPIPTYYGPGRLSETGTLCKSVGMSRPLIVTDRGSPDLPFMADLSQSLSSAGLSYAFFSDISPNPRDDEIAAGRAQFRAGDHDGIIGIGGGSGMDGAKAVCMSALNDVPVLDFNYHNPPPVFASTNPFPPLVTIPTTAGTGAETESTAMITDTARMMKWCLAHPDLKVAATVLDPEITVGLPKNLTAWTGFDALVHAVEAYCVPSFYPLCDGAALEALRLISSYLERAVTAPDDIEARGGMLVGSYLAGISFLKGLGLVHAISHMVGAEYDTHHGLTNAVVLPSVLQFNAPAIADKVIPMAQAMSITNGDFNSFYSDICNALDRLEIPKTLTDIGVPPNCAQGIADKATEDSAFGTNPRAATREELETLVDHALTVGR